MLIWVEESDTDMMRRASLGANAGSHQHGAAAPTLPTFRTIESERLCISRCLPSSTDFSRRRAAANTVRINVCEFSRDWMVHLHPAQPNILMLIRLQDGPYPIFLFQNNLFLTWFQRELIMSSTTRKRTTFTKKNRLMIA
jgi:hypothetical protein